MAAVDCGPVVNPGPIGPQIEGGFIEALSTAFKEQIEFEKGGVKSSNFDNYHILRMSDVPEIEVHIVKSNEKIGGIGEVGVPPTAPAVANAIFHATGVRIRRLVDFHPTGSLLPQAKAFGYMSSLEDSPNLVTIDRDGFALRVYIYTSSGRGCLLVIERQFENRYFIIRWWLRD